MGAFGGCAADPAVDTEYASRRRLPANRWVPFRLPERFRRRCGRLPRVSQIAGAGKGTFVSLRRTGREIETQRLVGGEGEGLTS